MAIAKIVFQKEVIDGEKRFVIKEFQNILAKDELPKPYLKGYPHFYLDGKILYMRYPVSINATNQDPFKEITSRIYGQPSPHRDVLNLFVGRNFTVEEVNWIIDWMRRAGHRLSKVKERIKKAEEEWKGEETFEI